MERRYFLRLAGCAALLPPLTVAAQARAGATDLVVGFPPGGAVDIAARLFGPQLEARLGEPFEVRNMAGESGNLATAHVAGAAPDGRTLLMAGPVNTINTTLFRSLPFRFDTDLVAVAGLYSVPLVVEVHPSVPAHTPEDFIELARSRRVRVGYAGVGTPQHIGIELFSSMAGVALTLVPYAGSAPALADLVAGRLDAMFDPAPSSIAHLRAGRLRPIAVTGRARLEVLPGVPLMSSVVPGYEAGSWFGLCAPRGTPAERIATLNAAANAALRDGTVKVRLDGMGALAMPGSPADFAHLIATETQRYARAIAQMGLPRH